MENALTIGANAPTPEGRPRRGAIARSNIGSAIGCQIEYVLFFSLIAATGLHYMVASASAAVAGIAVGLFANKYWAFARRDNLGRQFTHYVAVIVIGFGLGLGLLFVLAELFSVPSSLARPLADLAVYCAWMYPATLFIFAFRPDHADYRNRVRATYDRLGVQYYGDACQQKLVARLWRRVVSDRQLNVVMSLVGKNASTALDVGCGSGLYSKELGKRGMKVTAVDIAPHMLSEAKNFAHETVSADAESLNLNRSFEIVICIGVLDFVGDVGLAMRTLAKHVAPGGRLVVLVPTRVPMVLPYYLDQLRRGIRVNLLSPRALDRLATECGLSMVGSVKPLPHNAVLAWERGRAPAASAAAV